MELQTGVIPNQFFAFKSKQCVTLKYELSTCAATATLPFYMYSVLGIKSTENIQYVYSENRLTYSAFDHSDIF